MPDLTLATEEAAQQADLDGGLPAPRITRISLSGRGCLSSRDLASAEAEGDFVTSFEDYVVTASPDVPRAELDCTISLTLDAPDGVAYAPAGIDADVTTDSNSQVSISTQGSWASAGFSGPTREIPLAAGGRATARVFDEPGLQSACTGSRELTIATKLKLRSRRGRYGYAALHGLSALRFHATRCATTPDDAGSDALDAGVPIDSGVSGPDAEAARALLERYRVVGGPGCPDDSAVVEPSEDGNSFSMTFSSFTSRDFELPFCVLHLYLNPPAGYRADIASYVLDGRAQLKPGERGVLVSRYAHLDDNQNESARTVELTGPRDGAYQTEVVFPPIASGSTCKPSILSLQLDALAVTDRTSVAPPLDIQRLHSVRFRLRPCR